MNEKKEKDFYNNPFRLIWRGKRSLMPVYLWILWLIIIIVEFVVFFYCENAIDISKFSFEKFFTPSLTGLTFTLALFVAEKNIFSREELNELATHKGKKKSTGWAIDELLSPFMFTSILFLITGTVALLGQFTTWKSQNNLGDMIIVSAFIDVLLLALFGLFGLIVATLNDEYLSSKKPL